MAGPCWRGQIGMLIEIRGSRCLIRARILQPAGLSYIATAVRRENLEYKSVHWGKYAEISRVVKTRDIICLKVVYRVANLLQLV